jgi:hypothetical protein
MNRVKDNGKDEVVTMLNQLNRLERILTTVYVVQNYLASFGLCQSSGMRKFYKRP